MARQGVLYIDSDINTVTTTVNQAACPCTGFNGELNGLHGLNIEKDTGRFICKIPGTYIVIFNMSFTFTNAAPINVRLYKNGVRTPFAGDGWGITAFRSNLSFLGPVDMDAGDRLTIHLSSDIDGRELTIYNAQFAIIGI